MRLFHRKKKPKKVTRFQALMPAQNMTEFAGLLRFLSEHDIRNYLEIGCRRGGTFNMVMRMLPKGSRGVAVDLPGAKWGFSDSARDLQMTVDELIEAGFDAHVIFGNSRAEGVKKAVANLGPFDAALIDGDHLYDGVLSDWQAYGPLAKIVAFHDIVGSEAREKETGAPVEVPRLWQELKAEGHTVHEFVGHGSNMGIGVVVRGE